MKYRLLGQSDLNVSVVALGTMSWPGCRFGASSFPRTEIDLSALKIQLHVARDAGINLIDTAEGYGRGLAEELLGELLQDPALRKHFLITTKVGPLFPEASEPQRSVNLSPTHVRRCCEASLRRLGLDCLDLYLAHWPDPDTPLHETMGVMAELKKEGKIRWFGVSNFNNDQLSECLALADTTLPVVTNQIPYSLADRGIEADRLPFCQKNQIGIMAYSPLGKGLLGGNYSLTQLPPPNDYRHQRPHFAPENLSRNMALADKLRLLSAQLSITPAQLALAWALANPAITTVLPGAKTPDQLRDSAGAGSLTLPDNILHQLNA
ncbi:MAG: aldo/keto reductase [Blastochloris sp.]|nr:aldo/keto reductase [Blastochloris sp.]